MDLQLAICCLLFFRETVAAVFIFVWLHWVFVAECGPSLAEVSGDYSLVAVHGFLIAVASLVVEHRR